MIPPGFAGHVTLTIPEATVTGRADRPGELGGIGPIDPNLEANTLDRYQTVASHPVLNISTDRTVALQGR